MAELPKGVTTMTSTGPAMLPGVVAVITVGETIVNAVANRPPNETADAWSKPEPVIVTAVPPDVPPVLGPTLVTCGPGCRKENMSCWGSTAESPVAVWTTISTGPAMWAGGTALMSL